MPLRALLVDDELHARENLRMLLDEFCPEIDVIGQAEGVESAVMKVHTHQPDVVFLDIRMPSGSEGFDFLRQLPDADFLVVFVTAFKDYAIQAFNANAIHYLLKPIDIDDLRHAVTKVVEYHQTLQADAANKPIYRESLANLTKTKTFGNEPLTRITLHHSKGFKIVAIDRIVRLESDGGCTRIFFRDGSQFLDTRHLKVYEDMLPANAFFRAHRSHLINLHELSEYLHSDGHTAVMSDRSQVPVARARLSEFLTRAKSL
jgi:two-component system LytT family response regulator